jgi:hypothetical protein
MGVNLYVVIPLVMLGISLLIWLIYRNNKDEWKFEKDMDTKDEFPWKEGKPKNKHT